MEPESPSGAENTQYGPGPAPEKAGIETEDAGRSQSGRGEAPPGPTPDPSSWEALSGRLLGLGLEGEPVLSKEAVSEELAANTGRLDSETRRALKEIDAYASASALAHERASLTGRVEDLTMDLRDMREQIREMETAEAGLRPAFREAYRRPREALRGWKRLGAEDPRKARQVLVASPERLGALRGTSAFGFSTPARSAALRAAARAAGLVHAHADASRRAARLGAYGQKDGAGEGRPRQDVTENGLSTQSFSVEKGASRYPGLSQKREDIEAIRKEEVALGKKVKELTEGRPISEQKRAVTETVRSLSPKQRQALREVILGAGAQSVDGEQAGRGMARHATPGQEAASGREAVAMRPVARRNATTRSTTGRGQPVKKATSKAGAAKGLLKASLRHVAIHVAIRTLDRVEKEARGRELLEI